MPNTPRFISQLIEVVPSLWNPPPLSIASGGGSLLKRISDETGSSPVPASRAPAFPPLPHRLRDFRRVPPAAVEGVERRGAPVSAGRGEGAAAPPSRSLPAPGWAPGPPGIGGAGGCAPVARGARAGPLLPAGVAPPRRPRQGAPRGIPTNRLAGLGDWWGWRRLLRRRLREAALTRPPLRGAGQSTIATRVTR